MKILFLIAVLPFLWDTPEPKITYLEPVEVKQVALLNDPAQYIRVTYKASTFDIGHPPSAEFGVIVYDEFGESWFPAMYRIKNLPEKGHSSGPFMYTREGYTITRWSVYRLEVEPFTVNLYFRREPNGFSVEEAQKKIKEGHIEAYVTRITRAY